MPAVRRILVAVKDLRVTVRPVVRKAAQIASACSAQLEIYHCLSDPLVLDFAFHGAHGLEGLERTLREHALHRLERIAVSLRQRQPGLKVTVAAEWDAPAYDAVVRRALKIKADLIVAAAHSGPRILPGLMRLTDWELVRLSPVPLLLIKNPRPYRRPAVLVAVDPAHAFSKPLRLDQALLQAGDALSRSLRGTLHAVHAYARVPSAALSPNALPITDYGLRQVEKQAKRAAAANFDRALKGASITASRRYLIARHPVDAILQAARKSRSAIVVMGAVSRSGLKRLLIGNTAESILDELRCDVLVVKPSHFRNRVPRAVQGPRIMMSTPAPWPGSY
jgi:universal stress protein E